MAWRKYTNIRLFLYPIQHRKILETLALSISSVLLEISLIPSKTVIAA